MELYEKKYLSVGALLKTIRSKFSLISETKKHINGFSLVDCLMSGLAMFSLKMPSLLQFNNSRNDDVIRHNLKTLYGVASAPSDTYMREKLDIVDPNGLRSAYTSIFSNLQRGKILEDYVFMDGYYLIALDGSEYFSSKNIHCQNCCETHHTNGKITYHHQLFSGVIIHPDYKEVFPLCPEPIIKQDGDTKNDCETNACNRFLADLKREHPHLRVAVTTDSLHSTGPRIRQLMADGMRFIMGVKPGSHKSLFDWIENLKLLELEVVKDGVSYKFRWINGIPLNDSHSDLSVNFLECVITEPKTNEKRFTWVTNFYINESNVFKLSQGGRAKWKIENETFNTLKNQGYNIEHNYGHGYKYLNIVFMMLMMLAFFVDQVQQRACTLFQAALKKTKTRTALWEKQRALFTEYFILDWLDMFHAIATGHGRAHLPQRPP
jgi:hypothetical protein